MALYSKALHYLKNEVAFVISFYDSADDVSPNYIELKDILSNNTLMYAKLCDPSALNATDVRVIKDGKIYAVAKNKFAGTLTDANSRHWRYSGGGSAGSDDGNCWQLGPLRNVIMDGVPFYCTGGKAFTVTAKFNGNLQASTSAGWCEGWLYCSIVDINETTVYWTSDQLAYWTGPHGIGAFETTLNTAVTLPDSGDYKLVIWFAAHASNGDSCDIYAYSVTLTVS